MEEEAEEGSFWLWLRRRDKVWGPKGQLQGVAERRACCCTTTWGCTENNGAKHLRKVALGCS